MVLELPIWMSMGHWQRLHPKAVNMILMRLAEAVAARGGLKHHLCATPGRSFARMPPSTYFGTQSTQLRNHTALSFKPVGLRLITLSVINASFIIPALIQIIP